MNDEKTNVLKKFIPTIHDIIAINVGSFCNLLTVIKKKSPSMYFTPLTPIN